MFDALLGFVDRMPDRRSDDEALRPRTLYECRFLVSPVPEGRLTLFGGDEGTCVASAAVLFVELTPSDVRVRNLAPNLDSRLEDDGEVTVSAW